MNVCQTGLVAEVPRVGRYVFFELTTTDADAVRQSLVRLSPWVDGRQVVLGIGHALVQCLGADVPGLHPFAAMPGTLVSVPSAPKALLCWLRGDEMGPLVLLTRHLQQALSPALRLDHVVDAFRHGQGPNGHGQDLTGFEDGTENPQGEAALAAALCADPTPGLTGSSFMAVQQWLHDFDAFDAMSPVAQDHMVGRRRSDNEELDDVPASAHVKRTAQEGFEPEAFVLRRSMPWAAGAQAGLMFVAFGCSFGAFEAQLRRMVGLDDGVTDALFGMSRPLNTAYFWCPPMREQQPDWRQLGIFDRS